MNTHTKIETQDEALLPVAYASFEDALADMRGDYEAAIKGYARSLAFAEANRLIQPQEANPQAFALAQSLVSFDLAAVSLKHRRLDAAKRLFPTIRQRLEAEYLGEAA